MMGRFPLMVAMLVLLMVVVNGRTYGDPRPTNPPAYNVCTLPLRVGRCRGRCPRYYYDSSERKCLRFNYGCCGGNANNFKTKSLCQRVCMPRICPAIACFASPCQVETCPNYPEASCHLVCPCESMWLHEGEDVTARCRDNY
ncbi:fused toxin protein-like [Ostrea edulis]|uniref:fused toxin protein-like n=1 Tax=Ostrea edulis TaxID=37623 RepID=UPI0024AFA41D|nr:fused toxin protein-like [Ostrea edulis]